MEFLMYIQPGGAGATEAVGGGVQVPSWLPWALVGAGALVLGAVFVMLMRGRGGRRGTDAALGARQAAGEVAELKNQLIEVKKLAATVADDLDRRAARLERLIAQADEVLEERGNGERDAEPVQRGTRLRAAEPVLAPVDDLAQRVFALADQGRSAVQIAQALRQPVGNVELMLALRGGR